MQNKKISSNLVYSLLIQISSLIAPLITSPYIARVLSPELIGDYSFTFANSNYFTLLECLGLTLYGMIETAKIRDDKKKLSKLFWEISLIKLFFTIVCVVVFFIAFVCLGGQNLRQLYLIMIFNLLAVGIDTTWLLNGLEEFKITAIRSIAVRVINIFLILFFVKSKEDIIKYALIMQGSTFVSYAVMFPTTIKRITFVPLKELNIWRHLKPSLVYFVPGIITTVFQSTDKSILGIFSTSYEVGVYEQACKICQLFACMISAVSNTILPRAAYLHSNSDKKAESEMLFKTSIRICLFAALPICFGASAIADSFIPVFFGSGYEKSALLLKILCINIFFIALSNFYGQQALMARGKQKEYNISITISAVVNVALNLALVKAFQSTGVSIASAAAGLISFMIISHYGKDMMSLRTAFCISRKYLAAAALMFICIFKIHFESNSLTVLVQIPIGILVYFTALVIFKEDLLSLAMEQIRKKRAFFIKSPKGSNNSDQK